MKTIVNIGLKDLLLSLQNPPQLAITLIMPVVLMVIIGSAIPSDNIRLNLDIENRDGESLLAERLIETIENETLATCVYGQKNEDGCGLDKNDKPADRLTKRLEEATASAALIIPDGFSENLQAGKPQTLEYRSNEQLNAPTVISQSVEAAITRLASAVIVAQTGQTVLSETLPAESTQEVDIFAGVYARAEAAWQSAPPLTITAKPSGSDVEEGGGFEQSAPGMATMFVLISMLNGAAVLVFERLSGTLQRLYTLPVPRYQIVVGKMMGPFLFGLVQFTILIIVGQFIGVDWGGQWLAIAILVVSFVLCCAALGFALATLVRTEDQAAGVATFMSLTLAPLGGAWWPLSIVPDFMRTLGHISPIAWAMDAFSDLIWFNGDLMDILPEVGVLLVFAAGFTLFGVWRFRYE